MASIDQRVCYTRNGTRIIDRAYRPCSNDVTRDAPCCGTAHQAVGHSNVADDVCENNGLCQNFEPYDGTNQGAKLWWRQGCTDPTWQSDYCLKSVCNFGLWQNDNAPVRNCGDNKWCCGEKSCCSISSSIFALAATIGPTASSSASVSIATSNSAALTTGSTLPSPTSSGANIPAPSSGLSTGAQAGIGVGAAVVVILLGIIAWLLWRLKKGRAAEKMDGSVPMSGHEAKNPTTVYAYQEAPPVEMYAPNAPVEIGGPHHTELPGWSNGHAQEVRPVAK